MHNKSIKRGGRSKRIEKRLAKPIIDPCPPGQKGGSYKPLNQDDIKKIYNTAIDLLINLGVGEPDFNTPINIPKLALGSTIIPST